MEIIGDKAQIVRVLVDELEEFFQAGFEAAVIGTKVRNGEKGSCH